MSLPLDSNLYLVNTHSCSLNTNGGQHICYVNMCSSAPTSFRHSRDLILHRERALSTSNKLFDILLLALTDHCLTSLYKNNKKTLPNKNNGWDSAAVECSSFFLARGPGKKKIGRRGQQYDYRLCQGTEASFFVKLQEGSNPTPKPLKATTSSLDAICFDHTSPLSKAL